MNRLYRVWRSLLVIVVCGVAAAVHGQANHMTAATFKDYAFRSIGPGLTSGRISDVAVDPKNPSIWYVAASVGGLWKTDNRGNTFTPVFDTYGSYSLGAVTVDPRDSNIVWLGTGENNNQRSVSFGDGLYKSTDAGATWKRVGLENSEHIQNIVVDPRNSNVVYVTAIGPLWAPGGDRGLYKTTDGGQTWKAVLTISPDTGVTDMVMEDPESGVRTLEAALSRDLFSEVIVLTAYGNVGNAVECMRRGAFDYVEKNMPGIDVYELLILKIRQALDRRRASLQTLRRYADVAPYGVRLPGISRKDAG